MARIRDSDLRPQLVMALDHRAYLADALGDSQLMARLMHLAGQRLGKSDEARCLLDKATAWLDQQRDGMPDRAGYELGLHLHNSACSSLPR